MPENQEVVQATPASQEWTQESVEKQAAELQTGQEAQTQEQGEQPQQTEQKPEVKKVVPLSALHEARGREREAKARANQLEQQVQGLMRQQHEMLQRMNAPQQQRPGPDDPLGGIQHDIQAVQQNQRQFQEQQQRQAQENYAQAQRAAFGQAVIAHEAAFKEQQPDAEEGIKFWKNSLVTELEASGMAKGEAMQRADWEAAKLAWESMQRGDNPAEVAYNRGVARGYVANKQKLAMQKEGQQASMPNAGGGKSGGPPSLEALLKMDSATFNEMTEGPKWDKLIKPHMR